MPVQKESEVYKSMEKLKLTIPHIALGEIQKIDIPPNLLQPTFFSLNQVTRPF